MAATSNLSKKFEFLQERAQRRPTRDTSLDVSVGGSKRANIDHLKEFYLERLKKNDTGVAARLSSPSPLSGDVAQPQASGQHNARPTFGGCGSKAATVKDIEDLEIMCNNCFNLIKTSEASLCSGDPSSCSLALRSGTTNAQTYSSNQQRGLHALLDLKLQRLRLALEARLQDSSSKVNVMRHLTQLRYHIDTAAKWCPTSTQIGALSEYTVQQVKQLTKTSRVLAPAIYIFSKRIENVVVQKERELKRLQAEGSTTKEATTHAGAVVLDIEHSVGAESVVDVSSVVSGMNSDCGTQHPESVVTQDATNDVGNVKDANDYLSLKNEDEKRRWFYSQCLSIKLACPDKTRARKTLISDLYAKVREEAVPIEGWVQWIRNQLMCEGGEESTSEANPALSRTSPVPSIRPKVQASPGPSPGPVSRSELSSFTPSERRLSQSIPRHRD
eukprot:TRINITY_DN61147_c0_g1_i1.p1 TRINITY_DN61147_c0_g1~~TRINITY_DN61147_c0_g1_i1.p1  ORF type:complete len:444 (+),score=89.14 TRINITY_DN61147_c0_g1_i1:178-1509(+)